VRYVTIRTRSTTVTVDNVTQGLADHYNVTRDTVDVREVQRRALQISISVERVRVFEATVTIPEAQQRIPELNVLHVEAFPGFDKGTVLSVVTRTSTSSSRGSWAVALSSSLLLASSWILSLAARERSRSPAPGT
jgi:hypothetical protein